jgi:hypothetical protein
MPFEPTPRYMLRELIERERDELAREAARNVRTYDIGSLTMQIDGQDVIGMPALSLADWFERMQQRAPKPESFLPPTFLDTRDDEAFRRDLRHRMTVNRSRATEAVTLKPFSFRVIGYRFHGAGSFRTAEVDAVVVDRETGNPLELTFTSSDLGGMSDADLLHKCLSFALSHEIDECLFVNGAHRKNPHP